MNILPFFDFEKNFISSYLASKLGKEVLIWYTLSVGAKDVCFGELGARHPPSPLTENLEHFYICAEFFLHTSENGLFDR